VVWRERTPRAFGPAFGQLLRVLPTGQASARFERPRRPAKILSAGQFLF